MVTVGCPGRCKKLSLFAHLQVMISLVEWCSRVAEGPSQGSEEPFPIDQLRVAGEKNNVH